MQKQPSNGNSESLVAALAAFQLPSFHPLSSPPRHRKLRIALPALPRRLPCLTNRHVLAEERAAELAFWQVTGGDFLRSSFATDFVRTRQARSS